MFTIYSDRRENVAKGCKVHTQKQLKVHKLYGRFRFSGFDITFIACLTSTTAGSVVNQFVRFPINLERSKQIKLKIYEMGKIIIIINCVEEQFNYDHGRLPECRPTDCKLRF